MPVRNAEFEVVQYRKPDLLHASIRLIRNFVDYSGIVGTNNWGYLLSNLAMAIRDETNVHILWSTPVVDVRFTGFSEPIPIPAEDRIIFVAREPRFVFEEKRDDSIRPSVVTHVQRVTDAIAQEMVDVYRLEIVEQSPIVLIFPKAEYAKSVEVFNAALLTT